MSAILCHTNISEVVSKYPPKPVRNLTLTPGKFLVSLTWEDPADYTEEGYTCTWAKTVVIRKQGGYPNDIHDGTVVVTTVERDKYKTSGYDDTGLTAGETYYYRVFTCNTDGVYSEPAERSDVPIQYRTMTVKINLKNSNPATCGSYADDAVNMKSGKTESAIAAWQKFFGYRPCLFKDGKVVGYLNPNNFTKFEDGSDADITSGNSGNVMIEFPRRGIKISKSNKILTVSMTDYPNDSTFKYYAHQRGSNNKEYFYIGAYAGCIEYGKLVSLSNKTIKTNMILNTTLSECYRYGVANGEGYGCICYYQWLFIQVMYVLQFKGNLNSQSTVGKGCNDINVKTGTLDKYGLIYGEDSYGMNIKLFGLESMWSHGRFYINNYVHGRQSDAIQTTTDDTITDPALYEYQDYSGIHTGTGGWMSDCIGTTESGFSPVSNGFNGSSSTYFCDEISASFDNYILAGGGVGGDISGIFSHDCSTATRDNIVACGSHLQYL